MIYFGLGYNIPQPNAGRIAGDTRCIALVQIGLWGNCMGTNLVQQDFLSGFVPQPHEALVIIGCWCFYLNPFNIRTGDVNLSVELAKSILSEKIKTSSPILFEAP